MCVSFHHFIIVLDYIQHLYFQRPALTSSIPQFSLLYFSWQRFSQFYDCDTVQGPLLLTLETHESKDKERDRGRKSQLKAFFNERGREREREFYCKLTIAELEKM